MLLNNEPSAALQRTFCQFCEGLAFEKSSLKTLTIDAMSNTDELIVASQPFAKLLGSGSLQSGELRDFLYEFLRYTQDFYKVGNPYKHLPLNSDLECIEEFLEDAKLVSQ